MKTISQLLLALSIGVLTSISAVAELQPYSSTYYATFDRFSGRNTSVLTQDAESGEYTYSSYTKPRGLAALAGKIRETLKFSISDYKVTPKLYSHKSRKRASVKYDWSAMQAIASDKKGTKELALTGNELDLQSMQMQLMEDMNNDSLKDEYRIIKGTAISTYNVENLGTEEVTIGKNTYKYRYSACDGENGTV